MDTDTICYDGPEARKDGNHTRKQFMNIMEKYSKRDCLNFMKDLKCKTCKRKEMTAKEKKKQLLAIRQAIKNKIPYKLTAKQEKDYLKRMEKCNRCKKKMTMRRCNFDNYILYSGASSGKCQKINK